MEEARSSKKRAKSISVALFLIGLAILMFLKTWWPGITSCGQT
jgi:hypothetical protein